jgi:hypothetical protein
MNPGVGRLCVAAAYAGVAQAAQERADTARASGAAGAAELQEAAVAAGQRMEQAHAVASAHPITINRPGYSSERGDESTWGVGRHPANCYQGNARIRTMANGRPHVVELVLQPDRPTAALMHQLDVVDMCVGPPPPPLLPLPLRVTRQRGGVP